MSSTKAKVSELSKFLNTSKPGKQKIPLRNTFTMQKKSLSKTNGNSPKEEEVKETKETD